MPLPATLEDKEALESQIIAALSENPKLTMRDAAEAAGISRSHLYRLFEANPGMAERIKQARIFARRAVVEDVEQSLVDRALDLKNLGGTTAAIFLMKGHEPRYAERPSQQAVNVVINIDKAQLALAAQTIEEMRALEAREEALELERAEGDESKQLRADESDVWMTRQ